MIDSNQKQTGSTSADFPVSIGEFIFVKNFFPNKKVRHFDFAIYENENGKRAIAKQWNKTCRRIDYHWLLNEINVYKEINRTIFLNPEINRKYPNIGVPALLGVVREKGILIMLIEEIEGESLKTFPTEKQVSVFQNVIEYIDFLSGTMDSSAKKVLIKRSMWYVMAIFPFVFALALINHPKNFSSILRGGIIFSLNIFRILNKKDMVLVHRDLYPDHIIAKDNHFWIIDFQISAITNKAFEIAGLMIFMWKDAGFCDAFTRNYTADFIKKDKNKFYSYKILSIYLALYNLGAVKTIPSDQVFSYLNYALGLKFLK